MNQWELEANTRNQRQAREKACDQNACNQVAIGFGFASDWLRSCSHLFHVTFPALSAAYTCSRAFNIPVGLLRGLNFQFCLNNLSLTIKTCEVFIDIF